MSTSAASPCRTIRFPTDLSGYTLRNHLRDDLTVLCLRSGPPYRSKQTQSADPEDPKPGGSRRPVHKRAGAVGFSVRHSRLKPSFAPSSCTGRLMQQRSVQTYAATGRSDPLSGHGSGACSAPSPYTPERGIPQFLFRCCFRPGSQLRGLFRPVVKTQRTDPFDQGLTRRVPTCLHRDLCKQKPSFTQRVI